MMPITGGPRDMGADDNLPPGVSQAALDGEFDEWDEPRFCAICGWEEIQDGYICADCEDELEALNGTHD